MENLTMTDEPVVWHYGLMAERWAEFITAAREIPFFLQEIARYGQPVLDVPFSRRDAAHHESLRFLAHLFRWMLDFSLAPRFRFASAQERSNPTTLLPRFWLALVGFSAVQSTQMSMQESGFDLAERLKFQIARLLS